MTWRPGHDVEGSGSRQRAQMGVWAGGARGYSRRATDPTRGWGCSEAAFMQCLLFSLLVLLFKTGVESP